MFDVGGGELLLIVVAVLLLFGPKKIPEVARMVSKGMRHLKAAQQQFQSQLDEIKGDIDSTSDEVTDVFNQKKKKRDFSNPPPYMRGEIDKAYEEAEKNKQSAEENRNADEINEEIQSDSDSDKDKHIEKESTARRFRPKKPAHIKDEDESEIDDSSDNSKEK